MSTKRKRKPRKNLTHGAVEKELRSLHQRGQHVERQRDLTRALLQAVLVKHGNEIVVSRAQLDAGALGNSGVEQLANDDVRIIFTSDNPDGLTYATAQIIKGQPWWRRIWRRLAFWRRS